MTATPVPAARSQWRATLDALRAIVVRDLTVLDKNLERFVPSATMQPLLLFFVFTYLFPVVGQAVGGEDGAAYFSTTLLPGIVAQSILFVGIFSVGMDLILEIESGELEDRVLTPAPVYTVALAKVVSGALQALVAAIIVFPIAAVVPDSGLRLSTDWPVLLTILPLASLTAASLGLVLGTLFEPRNGPWLFSLVALPLAFFGCVFYTWDALEPAPVIQYAVLVNPLVYMSEGLRAGTVAGIPHMSLLVVYGMLIGFTVLFCVLGVRMFRGRVVK